MRGQSLYTILFHSLDLPDSVKGPYIESLLKKYNVAPEELTLDILREVVADLLHDTILELDQETHEPLAQNQ